MIRGGVVEVLKAKPTDAQPTVVAYLTTGESRGDGPDHRPPAVGLGSGAAAGRALEIPPEAYEEVIDNNFFLERLCELLESAAWRAPA